MKHGRRIAGLVLAGVLSLGGIAMTASGRKTWLRARLIAQHYSELSTAGVPSNILKRLAFSVILAGADPPGPDIESASAPPTSS